METNDTGNANVRIMKVGYRPLHPLQPNADSLGSKLRDISMSVNKAPTSIMGLRNGTEWNGTTSAASSKLKEITHMEAVPQSFLA